MPDDVFMVEPRKKFNFTSDFPHQLSLGCIQRYSLYGIAAAIKSVTYLHNSIRSTARLVVVNPTGARAKFVTL